MERTLIYQGQIFNSIREFTTKYNLPYQQTVNRLNQGYTLDQIVRGEKKSDSQPNPRHIAVSYKGHEYRSLRQFCQEHGLKYTRIYNLRKQGLTIEQIIEQEGINITFPEDDISKAVKNDVYAISDMSIGIRKVYEDNPYCVLGIPCNATRVDALERRDKLEKLNRLGVASTFKSEYDLNRVEKPNRDLGHIQVVLNHIDKMEYRWIWYLKDDYIDLWDDEALFKTCDSSKFEYDQFLACYYNVMISDPFFSDVKRWKILFHLIDWFFDTPDIDVYRVLSKRISDAERARYNYHMVVNSFRENIKKPLMESIDSADGNMLLSIMTVIAECEGGIAKEIGEKVNNLVIRWVDRSLDELKSNMNIIESSKSLSTANSTDAAVIYRCLDRLARNDFGTAKQISEKLDVLYSEMVMDKFKSQFYNATIVLTAGGRKKDACRFDSMIYIYCSDKEKAEIKRVYPLEWLEIPDSEFTIEECRTIARRYEKSEDWKNGFKWMMKAAKRGDAASQNDIGVYFALGRGRSADSKEAVKWYERAANGGSAVAWGNLAVRYSLGLSPFAKNPKKAKECYIKAFIIDKTGGYDKKLDDNFPGWKQEPHPLLTFSEKDWQYKIRPFAEAGITVAQYWYGVLLYEGKNGCVEDKNAARRWFLKAAVYDHPSAILALILYYGIDAQEATTAKAMFNLGFSYGGKNGDQNQDLRFYWYYKAVVSGYKSAYNNLGVCYHDGAGVETDYEKANEYFLKAIEYENNSGALSNYGKDLFWGHGVNKDLEKAKDYLLKARKLGNKDAIKFLEDNFGIRSRGTFDFTDFTDQVIYNNGGLKIEFCGLKDGDGKIQFQFWVKNTSTTQYNIWLCNIVLDGKKIGSFKKIGNYAPNNERGYGTIELIGTLGETSSLIEFSIEVDNSDDKELFKTKRVRLEALMHEKELQFSLLDGTGNEPQALSLSDNTNEDDEDDADNYDFADDDFEDIMIYNNGKVRVDFGGLVVDNGKVYIKIWSKNISNKIYKIWLKEIVVDGERISGYEKVATCMPEGSWNSSIVLAKNVDVYDYYDIEFSAEIDDSNNKALDTSKRVKVYVDFPDKEIKAVINEHENSGEDDDKESGESDPLFVENSFCMKNNERNGLEIYFPDIPGNFIRAAMKEQGWRWHKSKGCWYARDNSERRILAKKITGKEVQG